jgi:ATP-dependent 26S proteasome regulatory subunit
VATDKKSDNQQTFLGCLIWTLLGMLLSGLVWYFFFYKPQKNVVDLTTFIEQVRQGKVKHIDVQNDLVQWTQKDDQQFKTYLEPEVSIYEQLNYAKIDLDSSKLTIRVQPPAFWSQTSTLLWLFFLVISCFLLLLFTVVYENSMKNQLSKFKNNLIKKVTDKNKKLSFDEVGGAALAKQELKMIIEFLKNPERFTAIGAQMPKGVLLEGLPGTGKTLLAKAVASEADANFFYTSGSDFIEMFVGVGASRIRELFQQAKNKLPAIIYIDELDAIGVQRSSISNEESSRTLNQLLVELDGFEGREGLIVIASTNRAELLDKALIRQGRFDKRILVDLPNAEERHQILSIHAQKTKMAEDVKFDEVVHHTISFSGAELANIVNEAALLSAQAGQQVIEQSFLIHAMKRQGIIIPDLTNFLEIKQVIGQKIIGQDSALTAIAYSICCHYAMLRNQTEVDLKSRNKPNLFIYGSSGSGKTLMIQSAIEFLGVSYISITASSLMAESMENILIRLLSQANNDLRRAQYGIIHIYGMESLMLDRVNLQEELARIIEGRTFNLTDNKHSLSMNNQVISIETKNILFICELTHHHDVKWNGLDIEDFEIDGVKPRWEQKVSEMELDLKSINKTHEEKLAALGLSSRLLKQFPILTSTDTLDGEQLLTLLKEGDNSIINQFTKRCLEMEIQVDVEESAFSAMTNQVIREGSDVRSFSRILDRVLLNTLSNPASEGTITITEAMFHQAVEDFKS